VSSSSQLGADVVSEKCPHGSILCPWQSYA
jgi:hypothetical protein